MADYWFRPRRYGIGATPITWQGWLLTIVFLVILVVITAGPLYALRLFGIAMAGPMIGGCLLLTLPVTLIFVWISKAKTNGEWRWRFGRED